MEKSQLMQLKLELSGLILSSGITDIYSITIADYIKRIEKYYNKTYNADEISKALSELFIIEDSEKDTNVLVKEDFFEGF